MEKFEELNKNEKIKNENLINLVSDLANITGDKSFKILQETMIAKIKLNKLSNPTEVIKKSENDKDKIINFLQQINKLMDDFLKEMNIDE